MSVTDNFAKLKEQVEKADRSVKDAAGHIKLIVQINDWSLRVIAPLEMKTRFGWVRAKPACSAGSSARRSGLPARKAVPRGESSHL